VETGAQVILDGWGRSLKFGFQFHRYKLWNKRIIQIIQVFSCFLDQIVLEPEPKMLDAEIQTLKFEYWLHRPEKSTE